MNIKFTLFCVIGMGIFPFLNVSCKRIAGEKPFDSEAPIHAFCIDYNWSGRGYAALALPEDYNVATAQANIDWCLQNNINTIQTFAVSHNGYAWYDSKIAPKVPGLKGNFLAETVELGHAKGMRVLGYFSPGTNVHWLQNHPDEIYDNGSMFHIVFTKKYLDYLGSVIKEAIEMTGIDGFMIDSIFTAPRDSSEGMKWLPCEQEMYIELMGTPFPGKDKVSVEQILEFKRRAVERCWDTIYTSAKSVNPDCIIMLTAHDLTHEQFRPDSKIFKQADWLMNENPDPEYLKKVRSAAGPQTKRIQCISGWANHDAQALMDTFAQEGVGFYGFAWADLKTALPYTLESAAGNPRYTANAKNIEAMKLFYADQMKRYQDEKK